VTVPCGDSMVRAVFAARAGARQHLAPQNGLAALDGRAIPCGMADKASSTAMRIDIALKRIDAAARALAADRADLARRNEILRDTVGMAVATLDGIIQERGQD